MHGPIHYDSRWNGNHGIGRFLAELQARLPGVQVLRIIGPKVTIYGYRRAQRSGMGSYLLHVDCRGGNKNIARLVAAYASSHARQEIPLYFTGTPDVDTVQHAAYHGVSSRIQFMGSVSDDELAHLYCNAQALVFPSLREGSDLPVVEAMACGTPVITADATSIPEVTGRGNALLVDPHDVSALASVIDRICSDHALACELSAKGLTRSEAFSSNTVALRALQ